MTTGGLSPRRSPHLVAVACGSRAMATVASPIRWVATVKPGTRVVFPAGVFCITTTTCIVIEYTHLYLVVYTQLHCDEHESPSREELGRSGFSHAEPLRHLDVSLSASFLVQLPPSRVQSGAKRKRRARCRTLALTNTKFLTGSPACPNLFLRTLHSKIRQRLRKKKTNPMLLLV